MSQRLNHLQLFCLKMTMCLLFANTLTRFHSNRAPFRCGGAGDLHHECCHVTWTKISGSNTLLNLCHEELRQLLKQRGSTKVQDTKPIQSVHSLKTTAKYKGANTVWPAIIMVPFLNFEHSYLQWATCMLFTNIFTLLSMYWSWQEYITRHLRTELMCWG